MDAKLKRCLNLSSDLLRAAYDEATPVDRELAKGVAECVAYLVDRAALAAAQAGGMTATEDTSPIAWRIANACYEMVAGIRKQEGAEADVHFEGWLAHEIDQALKGAPAGAQPSEEDVRRLISDTLCSHTTSEPVDCVLARKLMALLPTIREGVSPWACVT